VIINCSGGINMEKAIIGKSSEVKAKIINNDLIKNVEKRVLIGSAQKAPNFVMRLFTVKPGGYSPKHEHFWEHEIFIVKGNADVFDGEKYVRVSEGDYVFVPPNALHQLKNASENEDLQFICVIPTNADEE